MKRIQHPYATEGFESSVPIEILDAPSMEYIYDTVRGKQYWHDKIKGVLADAGFATRRIEREEAHPVWIAWLTRVSFVLDADIRLASRQIRKVLVKGGVNVVRGEFNIFDRRGDKMRCVFLLDLGEPGVA